VFLLVYDFCQVRVFRRRFGEDNFQFFDSFFELLQRAIHHELAGGEDSNLLGDTLHVAEDVRAEKDCPALFLDYLNGMFQTQKESE